MTDYANTIKSEVWEDGTRYLMIPIVPVAKARPRFTKTGHAYTPDKTKDYEETVRQCWQLAHKGMATSVIELCCDFYMPIPKTFSKGMAKLAEEGKIRPDKKPDIDNLVKAVQDALNAVAYTDDKLIASEHLERWYSYEPRVEIRVKELKGD